MKKILVGVDGSDTADAAALTAGRLAQATGATLVVASAYGKLEVEQVRTGAEQFFFSNEDEALNTAKRSALRVRDELAGLEPETVAVEGKAAEALVDLATARDIDLVVVGNKRVQGLARVLGSVAADIARTAPCDVYIAHTH